MNDELAMKFAETTDLSPNQALELIEKHGRDLEKLQKIAETMRLKDDWTAAVALLGLTQGHPGPSAHNGTPVSEAPMQRPGSAAGPFAFSSAGVHSAC